MRFSIQWLEVSIKFTNTLIQKFIQFQKKTDHLDPLLEEGLGREEVVADQGHDQEGGHVLDQEEELVDQGQGHDEDQGPDIGRPGGQDLLADAGQGPGQ